MATRKVLETQPATRSTVELTDALWAKVAEIASDAWKTPNKRYTRDEVIEQLLWLGIDEWARMERAAKSKSG